MKRPASALTTLGFTTSAVSVLIVLSAPIGYRMQLLPLRLALLTLLRWGAYVGGAAALISVVAVALTLVQRRRGLGLAVLGLLVGAAAFGVPASQQRSARRAPPIHDITTDLQDPPEFVAVVPLRTNAPNPVAYGGEKIAVQQQKSYPDIVPVTMNVPPPEAFARALATVSAMEWDLGPVYE